MPPAASSHPAAAFLRSLEGVDDAPEVFFAIKDNEKSLVNPRNLFGTLQQHLPQLETLNRRGAGIFVAVNKVQGTRRIAINVRRIRALFVDGDDVDMPPAWDWPLTPTWLHQRVGNPRRWAAFWALEEDRRNLALFPAAQKALAAFYHGDPAVCDLPRVMRLPGFLHCKNPDQPDQYLRIDYSASDTVYDLAEVLDAHGIQVGGLPAVAPPSAPSPGTGAPLDLGHQMQEYERQALLDRLAELPALARHTEMYSWVCDAVAACLPDPEVLTLAHNWMAENGRQPRAGEVEELLRDAKRKARAGTLSVHTPGVRADLDFPPPPTAGEAGEGPATPPPSPAAVAATVKSNEDASWGNMLQRTDKGAIKDLECNYDLILRRESRLNKDGPLLRWNLFSGVCELAANPPWPRHTCSSLELADSDVGYLQNWLQREFSMAASPAKVRSGLLTAASRNPVHPVREYLARCASAWDRQTRLPTLLATYWGATADGDQGPAYLAAVGQCMLLAAVARVMRPGCKVDAVPILEGPQGTRKSTSLRILAGDAWFSDAAIDISSKDASLLMRGKWIVELGELQSLSRAEVNSLKAWVSRQYDRQRDPYGHFAADYQRQSVCVGTTNETSDYLRDASGNRRWWPILTTQADIEALARDRDQLWGEATVAFEQGALGESGARWWLPAEMEAVAHQEAAARDEEDSWEETVQAWISAQRETGNPRVYSAATILESVLGLPVLKQTRTESYRLGRIMKRLKLPVSRTVIAEGIRKRGWKI